MTATTSVTAADTPPLPKPDALTAFFWDAVREHRLELLRCQNCGHYVHFPRPICDRCQSMHLAPEAVSGRATLYSYTWATQAFHPYYVDKLPYVIAVVDIAEEPGVRLTTNLVDIAREDVKVGIELEVTFREVVPGLTLPLFGPATAGRAQGTGESA
jgi:uncharacterized OB-fold protein